MTSDLITRLEQAEEGSRELDLAVERLTNTSTVHDDHLDRFPDAAKPFTTSLDAIVALTGEKLPGSESQLLYAAMRELGNKHALHCRLWKAEVDGRFGERLSLALCIALLKALGD